MPTGRIIIRKATEGDTDVIVAFNQAMARETECRILDRAKVEAGVRSIVSGCAAGFYLVAQSGHSVVGMVMVTYEWSDWRNGWFWWLQSVYVRGDFRRQGVFRVLLSELRTEAASHPDVCGLRLYVERSNVAAQATYRQLGMEETTYQIYEEEFR